MIVIAYMLVGATLGATECFEGGFIVVGIDRTILDKVTVGFNSFLDQEMRMLQSLLVQY